MSRLTRIGVALSYLSLAAVPLYGASGEEQQVQSVPRVSAPAARDASQAETFRSRLRDQQKALQSYGEKISGLVDRLKAMSEATVESRLTEVRSLREALVQLGTQLQPDAPFSQSIDQFQSWISAQMGRVNSQRGTLGPEFVQELVARYREYQREVTGAREAVGNHSSAIDRALKELTTAEMRAAEMLMAEDAAAATKELLSMLDEIGQTIEDIRSNLRKLGNAGVLIRLTLGSSNLKSVISSGEEISVRVRLMPLVAVAVGASVLSAAPGTAEDRTAPRDHAAASTQPVNSKSIALQSQLAEQTPDGAHLIELYKAARTVTDVEAANGKVKDQLLQAQSVASELVRLHAAKMTACENMDASHLDATAAKATAFSTTLIRIEREITKSLSAMRQKFTERSISTRTKDDVNRYTVAAHQFGKLNLHTQEVAKAIQSVARNIRTATESCRPTPIPPLFAEGNTPSSKVTSITRSRAAARKRPANAAARLAPLLFRYY